MANTASATKRNRQAQKRRARNVGVRTNVKGAVKKAKAAGKDVKCTSCHEDTKDFKLSRTTRSTT